MSEFRKRLWDECFAALVAKWNLSKEESADPAAIDGLAALVGMKPAYFKRKNNGQRNVSLADVEAICAATGRRVALVETTEAWLERSGAGLVKEAVKQPRKGQVTPVGMLLQLACMTQADLVEKTGIKKQSVSQWVSGACQPNRSSQLAIAEATGFPGAFDVARETEEP